MIPDQRSRFSLHDFKFEDLKVGMKFHHPEYGEQIILDLGRCQFGPTISFHDTKIYSGQLSEFGNGEDKEFNIFEAVACSIFPYGAEKWKYVGMINEEEITGYRWQWFRSICPHCGYLHRMLSDHPSTQPRTCLGCGMLFYRPMEYEEK